MSFSWLTEMKDPDIIALGAQTLEGTGWNWTRKPYFFPQVVGWTINLKINASYCLGYKMGSPYNATAFPCMEPKRIICN
jgi:hypothetical protein